MKNKQPQIEIANHDSFIQKQRKRIAGVLKRISKLELLVYCAAVAAMLAALWPMLTQGVTLNDELQNRFDRKIGLWNMIAENTKVHFDKGRVLSLLVDWRFLGFLSENMFFNRCVCAVLILLNAGMIAWVLYRVCKDKHFSLFAAFLFVVLLPLSFQHAAPAAFTPLVTIPILFLGSSLLFYISFLENPMHKTRNLIVSAVLFFFTMNGYEFMILYAFLFPLLYIYFTLKGGERVRFLEMVKACRWHIAAGVLFLVLYFGLAFLFPSSYSGNQMQFVSLKSSWEIIKTLFLSAIPGYYCLNGVARYQMQIYNGGLLNANSLLGIGMLFLVVGTIAVGCSFAARRGSKRNPWWILCGIAVCLLYMLLPSIPNAISSMYQGAVTASFFTSLPVSWFLYVAAILLIAQLLWLLKEALQSIPWASVVAVCVCLCAVLIPQQAFNHVVGRVQTEDYQRLEMIEGVFETQTFRVCHEKTVYSKNIYEPRNLLAIHGGYWERLAALYDIRVSFVDAVPEDAKSQATLTVRDEGVVIWDRVGEKCYVLSKQLLAKDYYVEDDEGKLYRIPEVSPGLDGDYYLYTFVWDVEQYTIAAVK